MKRLLNFSMLFFITLFSNSHAEIYKWVDSEGRTHFGDKPLQSSKTEKVDIKINSYRSVTIEPLPDTDISNKRQNKSVIMYSTAWCGYCKKAREYFNANNIPFREFDIEKNKKANKKFKSYGGSGVPLILVGKSKMRGFSKNGFKKMYDKN